MTSEERREVAERLRELHLGGGSKDLIERTLSDAIGAWRESGMSWDFITERLADLIDRPICEMKSIPKSSHCVCSRCGAFVRKDAATDCTKAIPVRFCPNCGAIVAEKEGE